MGVMQISKCAPMRLRSTVPAAAFGGLIGSSNEYGCGSGQMRAGEAKISEGRTAGGSRFGAGYSAPAPLPSSEGLVPRSVAEWPVRSPIRGWAWAFPRACSSVHTPGCRGRTLRSPGGGPRLHRALSLDCSHAQSSWTSPSVYFMFDFFPMAASHREPCMDLDTVA